MHYLKKATLLVLMILLTVPYFCGCSISNSNENKVNGINPQTITDKSELIEVKNANKDIEYQKLINVSIKLKESNSNDIADITEEFIATLQEYLGNTVNIESIHDDFGINIISKTVAEDNVEFNLIIYDGNAIGLGTLERTWTFLQIIRSQKVELYTIYNKMAEYPLDMKVVKFGDDMYIISIVGVTNVSREHTSFISFWEYSNEELREFTDIKLDSYKGDDSINHNEYFMEFYDDNDVQFNTSNDDFGFFNIEGNTFKLNSLFKKEEVLIIVTN